MRRKLLSLFVLLLAASSGAWGQNFSTDTKIEILGPTDCNTGLGRQIKIKRATPVSFTGEVLTYWWFDRWEWDEGDNWNFNTSEHTISVPSDDSNGHLIYVRTVYYENWHWQESNTTVIWFNPNESLGQGPQLNGGIEVIDMLPAGSLNYGSGTVQYYNPKLRVYANTSGLNSTIINNLKLTLSYTTLDYSVDTDGTLHSPESFSVVKTYYVQRIDTDYFYVE